MRIRGIGLVVASMCLLGCSAEVAGEGETDTVPALEAVGEQSAAVRPASWPYEDTLRAPWLPPDWTTPFPYLTDAKVGTGSGGTFFFISNNHDFSLEVGGRFLYVCDRSQLLDSYIYLPGSIVPLKDGLLIAPHSTRTFTLPCPAPVAATDLYYRARAPEGATPFKDAVTQTGDGFNFFPYEQTRISASVPIARSNGIPVSRAGSHKLFIRYAHPHPGSPSALIKIGVQNSASGATLKTASNVSFAVTQQTDEWDQWQLVSFDFTTPSSSMNVYARLELQNGQIVYLDAAWVR